MQGNEDIKNLFEVTKTNNFEVVMHELDTFISLSEKLGLPSEVGSRMKSLKDCLEKSLIEIIKEMHPDCVFNLSEENIQNCGNFIEPYCTDGNSIISTNYDLLLYWVLMRYKPKSIDGENDKTFSDGFSYKFQEGLSEDDPGWIDDILTWNGSDNQNIFYAHGALHIFDTGTSYMKEQYDGPNGKFIMDAIRARIHNGGYPVFVTAGDANQKLNQIIHNGYLSDCYNHLKSITGRLVTFGFSFGNSDTHIIDALNEAAQGRGKLLSINIGVFSDSDRRHIDDLIAQKVFRCKVNTFDAKTAKIW